MDSAQNTFNTGRNTVRKWADTFAPSQNAPDKPGFELPPGFEIPPEFEFPLGIETPPVSPKTS